MENDRIMTLPGGIPVDLTKLGGDLRDRWVRLRARAAKAVTLDETTQLLDELRQLDLEVLGKIAPSVFARSVHGFPGLAPLPSNMKTR